MTVRKKQTATRKATAKKSAAKKSTTKKSAAKKASAKKTTAKKSRGQRTGNKPVTRTRTVGRKRPAKKPLRRKAVEPATGSDDVSGGSLPPPTASTAKEIGDKLAEVGAVLEILGENVFKVRAYENAARILPGLGEELAGFIERHELPQVQGIGKGIAERVEHLARYGNLPEFEEIIARVPPGLLEILRVPGLGPKKIKVLYDEMGIASLEALEQACQGDALSSLKGFGKKTQENILVGIAQFRRIHRRFGWIEAWQHARSVYEALRAHPAVDAIEVAGSLRRKRETVKDVDLLVSTRDPAVVSSFFAEGEWCDRLIGSGTTKTSIVHPSGLQIDLRVVTTQQFPHALHHFTGSKDHNVAMRSRAQRMGYKINEYGLFHGDELIVCKDEAELFATLGLDYIPPELREDLGEVQAAENHTLPSNLVEWSDLRGALHVHSRASCGKASVSELIAAAEELGWSWLGIADVTQGVDATCGLRAEDVPAHLGELRNAAASARTIRLFSGISVTIDARGELDLPTDLLQLFDYVIAGIHDHYDLGRHEQTQRLVTALRSGVITVLAHPLTRILGQRDPIDMDFVEVVTAAVDHRVLLEINGDPQRMDLDGLHAKQARDRGARFAVEPAATTVEELRRSGNALGMARRGWLSTGDVANADSADAMETYMQGKEKSGKETVE